ncbi:MAG: Arc family DNA-binding protein [Pseudomonas sp.]|nr:Arc family DNA-binding protein [Pseudomonas sp.]
MEKDSRYTRITLRIPRDLHERLAAAADKTSKSMNAEIVARLEESFAQAPAAQHVAPQSIIAKDFSQDLAKQIAQAVIAEMNKNK